MAEPLLRVEKLVRRFGGIIATDHVSLDVASGELHAIIGPNGAGKTTLISQLIGQLMPHSGTIMLAGRDITHVPVYRRSALGLARSFQITSLLPDFTAIDNVALAAQARDGHSFHFWRSARKLPHLRKAAQAALDRVGLGDRAGVRPRMDLIVVVLPMPLRPIIATISPERTCSDRPNSTWLRP